MGSAEAFAALLTVDVDLPDGTLMRIRPVRPDDGPALVEGFSRMSPETRFLRFFTAMSRLSPAQLEYFTHVDHVDHFAWVAFDRARTDEPGATPDGLGIGVARYIRLKDEPTMAEFAVVIVDEYQGRGIGTYLLEAIAVVASERGIDRLCAFVRAENAAMLAVFHQFGATAVHDEPGVTRVEIPVDSMTDHLARESDLRRALRLAAARTD